MFDIFFLEINFRYYKQFHMKLLFVVFFILELIIIHNYNLIRFYIKIYINTNQFIYDSLLIRINSLKISYCLSRTKQTLNFILNL